MKYYFLLTFRIISRQFRDNGINPILGILLLGAVFIAFSEVLFSKVEEASYIYALFSFYMLLHKNSLSKREFLKLTFSNNHYALINLLENIAITLPFILFLLIKSQFYFALLLIVIALISSSIQKKTSLSITFPTPFSKRPFEFASNSRKSIIFILLAYTLLIYSIFVDNPNIGIFSILICYIFSISFYTNAEDLHFVWISSENPKSFILDKFKTSLFHSTILAAPAIILHLSFYPQHLLLTLIIVIFSIILLFTIILMKYAEVPQNISVAQAIIFIFCIWFPPLLIGIIPYYYSKAMKNLNPILR